MATQIDTPTCFSGGSVNLGSQGAQTDKSQQMSTQTQGATGTPEDLLGEGLDIERELAILVRN